MKKIIFLVTAFTVAILSAQENKNYSFEKENDGFASSWEIFSEGAHKVLLDTKNVSEGEKSVVIENLEGNIGATGISFTIPVTFDGK